MDTPFRKLEETKKEIQNLSYKYLYDVAKLCERNRVTLNDVLLDAGLDTPYINLRMRLSQR